ncbi:tRNA uridine-5-carboxymethylaminomethyl(34) synthesis GTPase MnmE [soil metagenome]
MYLDTIAAIATAPGEGGVGIVRLSGPDSLPYALGIFRAGRSLRTPDPARIESHKMTYGSVVDPRTGAIVDEVMLVWMQAPRSYTREDVVEIHSHGGYVPVRSVLNLCLGAGARLAEPGEFTLRAFLNGRIDLSQAEAVAGVVSAQTGRLLDLAISELRGRMTERLKPARDALVETMAYLDAAADFPEDEIPELDVDAALERIAVVLGNVVDSAQTGMLYREGLQIAIVGRPNVGKSSLLNVLVGQERAIVTEIAGTTRDVVSETINLNGIPATLLDTAGITETVDVVEAIGVERSRHALSTSALVLVVLDASEPLADADRQVLELVEERLDPAGIVCVLNKTDLPERIDVSDISLLDAVPVLTISTTERDGLDDLVKALHESAVGQSESASRPALVTSRQLDALRRADDSIRAAIVARANGVPLDLIAVDVRTALYAVGEITGEHVSESVLDEIFSRFCIGK